MSRILVVEDSPTQAAQTQYVLQGAGHRVEIAPDGESAVDLLHGSVFDLVVSDIVMPGMSGFDLCRVIKSDPALKTTPVVLLTTLNEPLHIVHALECGADNYVTKPFKPDFLLGRVQSILLNRDLRESSGFDMAVEIRFLERNFRVNTDRKQILGMLLSTLEDVFVANQELLKTQDELSRANAQIREYAGHLEGKVRLTQEKYRTIMHEANDAILIVSSDRIIVEANRQAERLFQLPAKQLVGRNVLELYGQAQQHMADLANSLLSTSGEMESMELEYHRPDGTEVWAELNAKEVYLDSETVRVAVLRDITQRKRQETLTKESEERFRRLVEQSILGIMIVQKGKIVFCNRAIAQMLGHERPEDLIGTNAIDMVHPEDRHAALETGSKLLTAETTRLRHHYRGLRKDNSVMWYEPRHSIVEWQGRAAVQWILVDVTQERGLERQLELAQRMESVGRLAGGIAHDFNNILAVISSHTEFILDSVQDNAQLKDDATVVQEASARAAGLTRQLLAFSRRQVLQMSVLDVNAMVSGLSKMLVRLIGEDIKLETALEPALHSIRADATQIEQVVMNLVVNARDAMPKGGRVTIETANRTLDGEYAAAHGVVEPGEYVMLAVTDTGIGMSAETQKSIFEPFFTTKEQGKGTGLGLATVYGIVKQMNGAIFVYSELNRGTTFKIYFPAISGETAEPLRVERVKVARNVTETILLVEDDTLVRRSAKRILEGQGYKVLAAASADDALEIANNLRQPIDLLLTDVVMPVRSGPELWERIRPVRAIPVLFMSGYTDDAIVRHGILEGNFPFLTKPFARESLLAKVREALDTPPQSAPEKRELPES